MKYYLVQIADSDGRYVAAVNPYGDKELYFDEDSAARVADHLCELYAHPAGGDHPAARVLPLVAEGGEEP